MPPTHSQSPPTTTPLTTDAPSIAITVAQEQQPTKPSIKLGTDSEEEGEVKSIISTSPPPRDTSISHTSPPLAESVTEPSATEEPAPQELPEKTEEEKVKEFTSAIEEALEDGEIEDGEIAD